MLITYFRKRGQSSEICLNAHMITPMLNLGLMGRKTFEPSRKAPLILSLHYYGTNIEIILTYGTSFLNVCTPLMEIISMQSYHHHRAVRTYQIIYSDVPFQAQIYWLNLRFYILRCSKFAVVYNCIIIYILLRICTYTSCLLRIILLQLVVYHIVLCHVSICSMNLVFNSYTICWTNRVVCTLSQKWNKQVISSHLKLYYIYRSWMVSGAATRMSLLLNIWILKRFL